MARRLTKELAELKRSPLDWCTCEPQEDDILQWTATIVGPDGTPYEGGIFNISLEFPAEYPFKAPKVKFQTRIYHPHVRTATGEICADVLLNNWGPTLNVTFVLNTIRQMLIEPSTESPLEPEIGRLLIEDKQAFIKNAAKCTAEFAS
ncbi:ubiquitin-conjugating enzyme/RWD-like protein [Tribonema minus]|uniref:E2 ubiquitin-conjugating enzyme n=1 Tax=Tribonema minus TaxID=303371 RepID=A0A835YRR6_9STRA|nr:ubiquitin-conjugating enzyme/RWD-like protein [Tribonema minus]